MENYQILKNLGSQVIVKINPTAYKFSVFSGKPSSKAICAINVNYRWVGLPIGHVRSQNKNRLLTLDTYKDIRPCLTITEEGFAKIQYPKDFVLNDYPLVLQAGPTLIREDELYSKVIKDKELFRSDTVRTTSHTAIGCTESGKIILAYFSYASPLTMAKILKSYGCVSALKCDGGSCTALWTNFKKLQRLGSGSQAKAGLQFETKS